jgi:hypothetical protein
MGRLSRQRSWKIADDPVLRHVGAGQALHVEAGSDLVRHSVAQAEAVAACRISWAETFAAFARQVREVPKDTAAI